MATEGDLLLVDERLRKEFYRAVLTMSGVTIGSTIAITGVSIAIANWMLGGRAVKALLAVPLLALFVIACGGSDPSDEEEPVLIRTLEGVEAGYYRVSVPNGNFTVQIPPLLEGTQLRGKDLTSLGECTSGDRDCCGSSYWIDLIRTKGKKDLAQLRFGTSYYDWTIRLTVETDDKSMSDEEEAVGTG